MAETINNDKHEKMVFVTNDKYLREKGILDPYDEELLKEAAQGGQLVVMSVMEMLEALQKEEPGKFREFKESFESQALKPLTMDELVDLARQGDERKKGYDEHVELMMTKSQALNIRVWRITKHYSWRSVARAAFGRVVSNEWKGWRLWDPPSNQVMGMALCEQAAKLLGENYRDPPWN